MDNGYDHINTSWHNIIKWIFMILFSDPNRLNYVWLLSCFNYLSHYIIAIFKVWQEANLMLAVAYLLRKEISIT